MPNAPYVNPPVNPQVQAEADAIYFGWMGLAQDATFRSNMALIITAGIKNALIDPAVIAAFTLAIKNALIDPAVVAAHTLGIKNALIDPAVIAAHTLGVKNALIDPAVIAADTLGMKNALIDAAVIAAHTLGIKNALIDPAVVAAERDAIINAITQLVTNNVLPSEDDYRRWMALLALASTAVRKSSFLNETSAAEFLALKDRVVQMKNDVLVP